MNKPAFLLFMALSLFTLCFSCSQPGSKVLFDGKNSDLWNITGQAAVKDRILVLAGTNTKAVLKKGDYTNFKLTLELLTTPGGKGRLWFHTDPMLAKGYAIAINNDLQDTEWWTKSGSLLSVRNLTKSFAKENQWFTLTVQVEGKAVTVNINDVPVIEYIEPARPYRTETHAQTLLSSGLFALENSGSGEIQCRSIKVEALPKKTAPDIIARQESEALDETKDPIIRLHQENFPVLDFHVHLKGGLTKEQAAKQSRRLGINYAIAPNCGIGFPITNDEQIYAYLDSMRSQPFILAMQAEGREWITTFSPEARAQFDYVFTDALTFTDSKGRRTRLWIPEETWIEDEQAYMDLIVDKICEVLKEPVDIYVNPCFLPSPMDQRYDEFWTETRMNKFVDALVKSGKALEINEKYRIPNKAILLKAKAAGVKFTFGSNNTTPDVSDLSYSIQMIKECGLTAQDIYRPKVKLN